MIGNFIVCSAPRTHIRMLNATRSNGNSFCRFRELEKGAYKEPDNTPFGPKTCLEKGANLGIQSRFTPLPHFQSLSIKHKRSQTQFTSCSSNSFSTMNFLRSLQTKDQFQTEVVVEDDRSYFDKHELQEYEESTKKAAEMELILGNALALHQRDTGSVHKMERYGEHSAIEVGKRIASMHSRDEMSISNAHLGRAKSFDSRTSSFGSTASLPHFVRVQKGDSVLKQQNSWDEELKKYDSDDSLGDLPPGRDWSKLRREFDEQSKLSYQEGYLRLGKRGPSIGKRALGLGKKKDTSDEQSRLTYEEGDLLNGKRNQSIGKLLEIRKKILRDASNRPSTTYKIKGARTSKNRSVQRGYAMDYDVEVALNEKKNIWDSKVLQAALARREKLKNKKLEAEQTRRKEEQEALEADRGTRITVVEGYYVADDEEPVDTQEKPGTELHQIFGGACNPGLCTKK